MLALSNPTYDAALASGLEAYYAAQGSREVTYSGVFYLAGPMTGYPQFNFPAFDAAAYELRRRGKVILSPAEMDDEDDREKALASLDGAHGATNHDWADYLVRDLMIVVGVDGVVTIPGWEDSSGAQLETFVALMLGKPVVGPYQHGNAGTPATQELKVITKEDHPYQRVHTSAERLSVVARGLRKQADEAGLADQRFGGILDTLERFAAAQGSVR